MKRMAERNFKFRQKTPALSLTSTISANMQKSLPREQLLSNHPRDFDDDLITSGLDDLHPEKLRLTIVSMDFAEKCSTEERWYGTRYTESKIPAGFMRELCAAADGKDRPAALRLPGENIFIPHLEVPERSPEEPTRSPEEPTRSPGANLATPYPKPCTSSCMARTGQAPSHSQPSCAMREHDFGVRRARCHGTALRIPCLGLLQNVAYDAKCAGLRYSISCTSRGLCIKISGYCEPLSILLDRIVTAMRDLAVREEQLESIKDYFGQGYASWGLAQRVDAYISALTEEGEFTIRELAEALPRIGTEHIDAFGRELREKLCIEVLVHGDLRSEEALALATTIESTLRVQPLQESPWPIRRSLLFAPGSNHVYRSPVPPPHVHNCIGYWLYLAAGQTRRYGRRHGFWPRCSRSRSWTSFVQSATEGVPTEGVRYRLMSAPAARRTAFDSLSGARRTACISPRESMPS